MISALMHPLLLLLTRYSRLISFLVVGVLTAIVYFSLFTLFWKILALNYKLSLSLAYTASVCFQFICNRQKTFKSYDEHIAHQVLKFIGLLVINYALTISIVSWSVDDLSFSPYIGIILSLFITVITGFLLSKFWVFKISKKINPI